MSFADKLLDLHAAIEEAGVVCQSRGMAEIDKAWMLLPDIAAVIEEAEALVSDCGPCNGGVTDDDCFLCGHLRRALAALESRLNA